MSSLRAERDEYISVLLEQQEPSTVAADASILQAIQASELGALRELLADEQVAASASASVVGSALQALGEAASVATTAGRDHTQVQFATEPDESCRTD